jgi:hypothetical protein
MSLGVPSLAACPYRDVNDLALGGFVDRDIFRFVRVCPQVRRLKRGHAGGPLARPRQMGPRDFRPGTTIVE